MDALLSIMAQVPDAAEAAQELYTDLSWEDFPAFTWETWRDGGWLMIPLFLLALTIYYQAMTLYLRLSRTKAKKVPREVWEGWLDKPEKSEGHLGEVVRFVVGDGRFSADALMRIEAVRARIIPAVNSRITVLSVLVTIAPLMGLLGTVIGMLATFRVLSSAASTAVELVAEGIRIALITTQTGLMIAIPGYILIALVLRGRNRYIAFLAELESVIVQRMYNAQSGEERKAS